MIKSVWGRGRGGGDVIPPRVAARADAHKHGVSSQLEDVRQSCFENIVQGSGAFVGEKFIHWPDQLRIVCRTRREQDLRETNKRWTKEESRLTQFGKRKQKDKLWLVENVCKTNMGRALTNQRGKN